MALELSSRTADFREGLAAFQERRDARVRGTVDGESRWSSRRSSTRSPTAPRRSRSTGPTSSTRSARRWSSELRQAYAAAEADDDVWTILVTGNGRAFCTGADVGEIPDDGRVIYDEPYLSTLRPVGGAPGGHAAVPHDDQAGHHRRQRPLLRRRPRLGHHRRHRHRLGPGRVLRPAREHRPGVGPRDGPPRPGAADRHRHADRPHRAARAHERPAGLRPRPDLRGRRARPAPRAGPRDRRARQPQRAARRARHPPGHPQGPRPAAARGRDPGRGVPRAGRAHRRRQGGPAAFMEKRDPEVDGR